MNRRPKMAVIAGVGAAALVLAAGAASRIAAHQRLAAWSAAEAIPTVTLVSIPRGGSERTLQVPGDVEAFNSAPVHPRVSGYVKRWYVDIGAPVKAGQVLADVDTPDLDAQLAQAKADLGTAVANQKLAAITAKRWQGLLSTDAVSQQDYDDKNGDLAAKSAIVKAAEANLDRLQALESFKRITAPFDGVVTARNAQIGQLVAEGSTTTAPLFTVADETRLRVYVRVPQAYTAGIRPGMVATLTVPEYPGRTFAARLVDTSTAIDPATGAQTAELWIDNADRALKPGEYALVSFALPAQAGVVRVPASALVTLHKGLAVAVVGPDGRVQMRPLTVLRDLGTSVEATGGISPGEAVIDNPADTLRQGDRVRAVAAARPTDLARG